MLFEGYLAPSTKATKTIAQGKHEALILFEGHLAPLNNDNKSGWPGCQSPWILWALDFGFSLCAVSLFASALAHIFS